MERSNSTAKPATTMKCETDRVCDNLRKKNIEAMVHFYSGHVSDHIMFIYLFIHSFIKQSSVDTKSLHTKESHTED